MLTLAIETSTPHGSVAVHDGEHLLIEQHFAAARGASGTLFPVLESVLGAAPRIEQIAVGLGPGSYAGVRLAIAAAIGLELALECRLAGLPSVAAFQVPGTPYVAIGDARRETFYWTEVNEGVCSDGPLLLTQAELLTRLARSSLPIFSSDSLPLVPGACRALPTAALLAARAARGIGITALGNLEPIYLREPHITLPAIPS